MQGQVYLICKCYSLHRSLLFSEAKSSELEKVREREKKKKDKKKTQEKFLFSKVADP